jgi:hypothetical protein
MPGVMNSYRAFRNLWVGRPDSDPRLAIRNAKGPRTVYAAWNGSTETVAWRLLSGPRPGALAPILRFVRNGFETKVTTKAPGPFYRLQALDSNGNVLGVSALVSFPQQGTEANGQAVRLHQSLSPHQAPLRSEISRGVLADDRAFADAGTSTHRSFSLQHASIGAETSAAPVNDQGDPPGDGDADRPILTVGASCAEMDAALAELLSKNGQQPGDVGGA